MEYDLKHYYRVKYALVCARNSFLKNPPKDDYEEYARKVINRAYFIILNKIDEFDDMKKLFLNLQRKSPANTRAPRFKMIKHLFSRRAKLKSTRGCFFVWGVIQSSLCGFCVNVYRFLLT